MVSRIGEQPLNHFDGTKNNLRNSFIREYRLLTDVTHSVSDNSHSLRRALMNLRMTRIDGTPSTIDTAEHLLLGSIGSAYNLSSLLEAGVTHILCLSDDIQLRFSDSFTYLRIAMVDRSDYDIAAHFSTCFEFMLAAKAAGGRCLVHCYMGKSRSVAVVCAYLIHYSGMSPMDALDSIRKTRPGACPNSGFMRALNLLKKCE